MIKHIFERAAIWLATGAKFGLSPFAPGTIGALWGIPLAIGISYAPWIAQVVVIILLLIVGVPICTEAARQLGTKDPGSVVWDEIASVPITFLFVQPELVRSPWVLGLGFLLHRFFDIAKIPPARQFEALPDGWGIMSDDVAAGIYSCLTLHAMLAAYGTFARGTLS